ncbi:Proton-dependent oligopeptide transporter family [Parasponia andersonii]|uniref:Proton-dependent oligopeptide transporter family n=1 Tax=Parasponia andersonii TaxID=3476 RepID=A0A2P5AGX3_PARAD|nr:Proton-dependent oligopeptide transporter family [Parasponia andersonii]
MVSFILGTIVGRSTPVKHMGRLCGLEKQTCLKRPSWRHSCCFLCVSCGDIGEPSILGQCKQSCAISVQIHAFFSFHCCQVTNFMGTAFLLALLGGFLADAFFTTYSIYVISAAIEFMELGKEHLVSQLAMLGLFYRIKQVVGLILEYLWGPSMGINHTIRPWTVYDNSMVEGLLTLTIRAQIPSLKPPTYVSVAPNTPCQEVAGWKEVMLFAGLYLVALGVGGIKGSIPSHGAQQFDETTPRGSKQRSAFFNYYVFCLSCGALIAVT